MFKQLLVTELQANRWLLLSSTALNSFFVVLLGAMNARPLALFMFLTVSVYFLQLILMTVNNSDQHRKRLYAQLPVTTLQVFWAQWLFCLGWLAVQALVWLLYGALFDPAVTTAAALTSIVQVLIGVILVLALVSIEIDLFAYHPVYLRWLYLVMVVVALGLAVRLEGNFGLIWADNEIALQPFAQYGSVGIIAALLLALMLVAVDRHVFQYSENFLD